MSERVKEIVPDLIEAIRNVLRKHKVTFDEYRAGFGYMIEVQEAKEIPLLLDALLNSTIVEIENETRGGTRADIQGPYYLDENYPSVTDALAVRPEDADAEDMIIRGRITDLTGQPVLGATIDIWHSTPDGLYSGIHDNIDRKYYRGRVVTDADGRYSVTSKTPVAYQIPNQGPTGALLEKYLGRHSWRPAHIHFWVRSEDRRDLINQAYFEGGDYVGDDCCETDHLELVVPKVYENGKRVMQVNFVLEPAYAIAAE
jgi:chlorocatechol 1,2-dioxygenase